MNRAKNLLKEEYLTIQKRWEYWFDRLTLEEPDEEVEALEKFWRQTLFMIKDLIKNL
jgi:hypothetical protein|nr:MAG TPA: hypothetical protein [Caudoviricetes sp.]